MATPPFKVKATYEYTSAHDDDLNFPLGQIITVTEEEGTDWYVGEYTDHNGDKQDGLFPRNFIERLEPEAPPRPTRSRPKKEQTPVEEPQQAAEDLTARTSEDRDDPEPSAAPLSPAAKAEPPPLDPEPEQPAAPKPPPAKPATASKAPPPPPAEKPASGSFKDRIAAFNKPAAPPIAPKPSAAAGGGSSGFIKKPFVAPPPARNAYVPPPKPASAQKVYRRDEDPEIAQRTAQDQEDAAKAGLARSEPTEEGEENAPKSTSLKDRIALLQKQQQEQATRRAEAATKEKPKRPAKPRTTSGDELAAETQESAESPRVEATEQSSFDDVPEVTRQLPPRRPTKESKALEPEAGDSPSDGNEADQSGAGDTTEDAGGTSTEVEESDEKARPRQTVPLARTSTSSSREASGAEKGKPVHQEGEPKDAEAEDEEEEEEGEVDPEVKRKMELRERMAKMSGGMGMGGMLGGGMPASGAGSKKPKSSGTLHEIRAAASPPPPPQRTAMVAVPGILKSPAAEAGDKTQDAENAPIEPSKLPAKDEALEDEDNEELQEAPTPRRVSSSDPAQVPPLPKERPLPAVPPSQEREAPLPVLENRLIPSRPEARPVPPPPPRVQRPPSDGSEDSMPDRPSRASTFSQSTNNPKIMPGPPSPIAGLHTNITKGEGSQHPPNSPPTDRQVPKSSSPPPFHSSPPTRAERTADCMPPMPVGSPQMAPQTTPRPPPPPPPSAAPPLRRSLDRDDDRSSSRDAAQDEESEYEGDYDTDIASGAPHKDALKSRGRDISMDETTLSEESFDKPPPSKPPMGAPPSIPSSIRGPPPPPPHQAPPARQSTNPPRVPPPPPPQREPSQAKVDGDEYDPYKYTSTIPSGQGRSKKPQPSEDFVQESNSDLYEPYPKTTNDRAPPPAPPPDRPPQRHAVPPPLPPEHKAPLMAEPPEERLNEDVRRGSLEAPRRSTTLPRRSVDSRPGEGEGYMARPVDLGESSVWWATPNLPPPAFQNRNDVLCEMEEASTSKRGGRTTISKDVYILFTDYSQTVVNVRYDASEPSQNVAFEQRHEPPPPRPRQDRLEAAHGQFGQPLAAAATARQGSVIADGKPHSLVTELLATAVPSALRPVGTKAFGALVYANMANASVTQYDEIRPGDVVSFRNARFQGKHGAMHAKYGEDVGKPEHVAIVVEWDGTKKKVRAWEQGRVSGAVSGSGDGKEKGEGLSKEKHEKKGKVKVESFKLGDLRSGEVKIWRVMGREWVGWDGGS